MDMKAFQEARTSRSAESTIRKVGILNFALLAHDRLGLPASEDAIEEAFEQYVLETCDVIWEEYEWHEPVNANFFHLVMDGMAWSDWCRPSLLYWTRHVDTDPPQLKTNQFHGPFPTIARRG